MKFNQINLIQLNILINMVGDISEFIEKAKQLYLKNPSHMRCSIKVRGANDEMVFKVTDDTTVYKYKICNLSKNEQAPEQHQQLTELFFGLSANFDTQSDAVMQDQEGSAVKQNQNKGGKNQKKKGKK